jgi:hypothetical protein
MERFFSVTAVGMRFSEPEPGAYTRELMSAPALLLRPEPQNEHDPLAVQICTTDGRALAHVSRDTVKDIPSMTLSGRVFVVHHSMQRGNVAVFFTFREN